MRGWLSKFIMTSIRDADNYFKEMKTGTSSVIDEVERRAYHHWWVGAITVSAASFVLVIGLIVAIVWLTNPKAVIPDKPDAVTGALIGGMRLFSLIILGYLVNLLMSMYKFNIQLWGHYTARAWAMRLAAGGGEDVDVKNLNVQKMDTLSRILSPSVAFSQETSPVDTSKVVESFGSKKSPED